MSMPLPTDPVAAAPRRRGRGARPRRWPGTVVAVGLVVSGLALLAALVGPLFLPDATQQDVLLGVSHPSAAHPLGTDDLGRDVLQMVAVGARSSVLGALLIAAGSLLLGHLIGLPAGYRGGWVDQVAMRWTDLMFSLPALLVAIVVTGVVGGGYLLAVLTLVVLFSPGDTRVVRAAVLEQRQRPYVEAARLSNLRDRTIALRYIWPNIAPVVTGNAFLNFGFALVALSSLSFLGLGIAPGSADWGRMLADNRSLLLSNTWAVVAPGLAIIATAAAVNVVGDWLHRRLDERGLRR
jgi:peptide/nickel transport system permease protein